MGSVQAGLREWRASEGGMLLLLLLLLKYYQEDKKFECELLTQKSKKFSK